MPSNLVLTMYLQNHISVDVVKGSQPPPEITMNGANWYRNDAARLSRGF
jgi:hypothetical protein